MKLKIFLFLSFLFLIGCIDPVNELSISQRRVCLSLTSFPSTSIPFCESKEACFNKVNELLPENDLSEFSLALNQKIGLYKNSLAFSWFYFNKIRTSLNEINKECNQRFVSNLSFHANESISYLNKAIEELNKLNLIALEIIVLEIQELELQEINLIKEEPIFDSYLDLINNLNDLFNGNKNSKTFVGLYFFKSNELNKLIQAIDSTRTVKEFTLIDVFAEIDNTIFSILLKNNPFAAIIKNSAFALVHKINFLDKTVQGNILLGKANPSEFFSLFDSLASPSNSATEKFIDLIKTIAKNKKNLKEKTNELINENKFLIESIQTQLNALDSNSYQSFNEEFISSLISLLQEGKEIQTQKFELNEINQFKQNNFEKLDELKKQLNKLLNKNYFNNISNGKKVIELKNINSELKLLNDKTLFYSNELTDELIDLCNSRANFIRNEINKEKIDRIEVIELKNKLTSKIIKFNETKTEKEKLIQCKPIVEDFKLFKKAINQFTEFEVNEKEGFEKCLNEVNELLKNPEIKNIFFERLNNLKLIQKNKEYFNGKNYCIELKKDITFYAYSSFDLSELKDLLKKTNHYLELLGTLSTSKALKFKTQINYFNELFSSNEVEEIIKNKLEIKNKLLKLFNEIRIELIQELKIFLEENIEIQSLSNELFKTDKKIEVLTKYVVKNPFNEQINEEINISIPLNKVNETEIVSKTQNIIKTSISNNKIEVTLNELPLNQTELTVKEFNEINVSEIKTIVLNASEKKALILKEIKINLLREIEKAVVSTELIQPIDLLNEVSIYSENKKIPFGLKENEISFLIEKPKDNQIISIYYYILNPIKVSLPQEEIIKLNEKEFEIVQEIKIKNNLPLNIENTVISLNQFNLNETLITVELFNESGKSIKLNQTTNKIEFNLNNLNKEEEITLTLYKKIENLDKLIEKVEKEIEMEVNLLILSDFKEVKEQALNELKELNKLMQIQDNKEKISKLEKLKSKINDLSKKNTDYEKSLIEINSLKKEALEQINYLEKELNELEKTNMKDKTIELKQYLNELKEKFNSALENELNQKILEEKKILLEIQSLMQSKSFPKIKKELMAKYLFTTNELNTIFEKINNSKLENPPSNEEKKINSMKEEILTKFNEEKYFEANELLNSLSKEKINLENHLKNELKSKSEKIILNARQLNELISNRQIENLIQEFEDLFDGLSKDELNELAKYIPLSKQELSYFKRESKEIINKINTNKLNEIESLFNENKFLEIASNEKDAKEIENSIKRLQEIKSQLESKKDSIKNSAIGKVKQAEFLLKENPKEDAKKIIEEAQKNLEEKKYLDALKYANAGTSLLSLNKNAKNLQIPLALYPLVILIVLIIGIKFYSRKKEEKVEQKKIPRNI